MKRAKMKRGGIRPFRIMAVFLSVVALVMICKFPERAVVVERRQEQLAAAAERGWEAARAVDLSFPRLGAVKNDAGGVLQ